MVAQLHEYAKTTELHTFFCCCSHHARSQFPNQGWNPLPLGRSRKHWTAREVPELYTLNGLILWCEQCLHKGVFKNKQTCLSFFPNRKARVGSQKMTSTGLPGNSPETVLLMPPQLLPEGFPSQGLASSCKNHDEAAPWRPQTKLARLPQEAGEAGTRRRRSTGASGWCIAGRWVGGSAGFRCRAAHEQCLSKSSSFALLIGWYLLPRKTSSQNVIRSTLAE